MTDWLSLSVKERDVTVREIMKEGEDAYLSSGKIIQCPYGRETQQAEWWRRGFGNAAYGAANRNL